MHFPTPPLDGDLSPRILHIVPLTNVHHLVHLSPLVLNEAVGHKPCDSISEIHNSLVSQTVNP